MTFLKVVGCVIAFVLLLWVLVLIQQETRRSDETVIRGVITENHCRVESIERTWLDHGGFWLADYDNDRFYIAKVVDKQEHPKTVYFKFNVFGHDLKWE